MIWLLLLASLCTIGWGGLTGFAYTMSDNPMDAEKNARHSCLIVVAGVVGCAFCVWRLV